MTDESPKEEILVNVTPREVRAALLENGILQEVYIERSRPFVLTGASAGFVKSEQGPLLGREPTPRRSTAANVRVRSGPDVLTLA